MFDKLARAPASPKLAAFHAANALPLGWFNLQPNRRSAWSASLVFRRFPYAGVLWPCMRAFLQQDGFGSLFGPYGTVLP